MAHQVDEERVDLPVADASRAFFQNHDRIIVARAQGTEFSGIADGNWEEVPLLWDRGKRVVAANLERVVILKTAGGCNKFDVEIRAKEGGTDLDVIYRFLDADPATGDLDEALDPAVPWLSEETGRKRFNIFLAIKPKGGDGTFIARVYARPRR